MRSACQPPRTLPWHSTKESWEGPTPGPHHWSGTGGPVARPPHVSSWRWPWGPLVYSARQSVPLGPLFRQPPAFPPTPAPSELPRAWPRGPTTGRGQLSPPPSPAARLSRSQVPQAAPRHSRLHAGGVSVLCPRDIITVRPSEACHRRSRAGLPQLWGLHPSQ